MNFQKVNITRDDGSFYSELSVAQFNKGYSHIIIDDGCYQIINGDRVSSHMFPEACSIVAKLPSPIELQRNDEYREALKAEKI